MVAGEETYGDLVMAKIRLYCDSGANIHSSRQEVIDLKKDWNIGPEEWAEMSDSEKEEIVKDWAYERLEIGWEPVEE
jgi:hypothetical protein